MERFSKNREAILDCLRGTTMHPSAEWVYAQLKPANPSLSLGTVYRNLCQLKDARVIRSIGIVAGQERFDGDVSAHAHVICTHCGRIVDLPINNSISGIVQYASDATGFQVTAPSFMGTCPDCMPISPK